MIRHGFALLIQAASWKDLLRAIYIQGESRKHFIRLHALTRRLLANTASARLKWRCENDMRAFSEAEWADGHEAIGAPRHRAWNWKQEIPLCRPKGGIRSFAKDNLMYVSGSEVAPLIAAENYSVPITVGKFIRGPLDVYLFLMEFLRNPMAISFSFSPFPPPIPFSLKC